MPHQMPNAVEISICDGTADAGELADFFCANLTPEYISHSELQSNRTTPAGDWVPEIVSVIGEELEEALSQDIGARASAPTWNGVVVARVDGRLAGIAIVLYVHDAGSYGVIEDILVDSALRGRGVGTQLINFILADMRASNLSRAFLESGINNDKAHDLFHQIGFENTSVIMGMEL
jgi:ribosomal protein S18 acetylase RimI-like enzyme